MAFLQFRQQTETLQGVIAVSKEADVHQVSKQMVKYSQGIPAESIVVVEGEIKKADVKSCTIQQYEISIHKVNRHMF